MAKPRLLQTMNDIKNFEIFSTMGSVLASLKFIFSEVSSCKLLIDFAHVENCKILDMVMSTIVKAKINPPKMKVSNVKSSTAFYYVM